MSAPSTPTATTVDMPGRSTPAFGVASGDPDSHRKAADDLCEITRGVVGRHEREFAPRRLADGLDITAEMELPIRVERDRKGLVRFHARELRLAEKKLPDVPSSSSQFFSAP